MPYKWGNEVPLAAVDTQPRIEAIAEGIVSMAVNTVETENTWFEEQVNLYFEQEGYHTEHRNLHLDYSASRNWHKWGRQVLMEQQAQSMCAYFDHSSYRMPSHLVPLNDMQYRFV